MQAAQSQFRPPPPQHYDPLKFFTTKESSDRALYEMEKMLDVTENCREYEVRDIAFAY